MHTQCIGIDRFREILAKDVRAFADTVKFLLPLSNKQKIEFYKQILVLGEKSGQDMVEEA